MKLAIGRTYSWPFAFPSRQIGNIVVLLPCKQIGIKWNKNQIAETVCGKGQNYGKENESRERFKI